MPELPEISILARQMSETIVGRRIESAEVVQPKCLNIPPEQFREEVTKQEIVGIQPSGKWLDLRLSQRHLLLNLGMGGDLLYFPLGKEPAEKRRALFALDDGSGFTVSFFWFGYIHLVKDISEHPQVGSLGMDPLSPQFTVESLKNLLAGRRGNIKSLLTNQRMVAGIGNVYIQDILFSARLHPKRRAGSLSEEEVRALQRAITNVLHTSVKKGGLAYERDFFGNSGRFRVEDMAVGYREGKPCPLCGSAVEKIKTGSTSQYICPHCQKL